MSITQLSNKLTVSEWARKLKLAITGVLAMVLAACAVSGSGSTAAGTCMLVRQFPSDLVLKQFPQPQDGRFSLSFIHSVSGTPVRDDYQIVTGRIVQTAETFQAHGAGLPSGSDEPGVTGWEHHNGRFIIRMHRPISRLIVRTDRNYRNRLHINDKEINLNSWSDQALELVVVPCTGQ